MFLVQGAAIWFVSLPCRSRRSPGPVGTWLVWVGVALWPLGLVFESVGDAQLAAYKKDPDRKPVMDRGLWGWTRHPNYFGDASVWWGIWLVGGLAGGLLPALTIVSPIAMTYFLVFATGARLLESSDDEAARLPGVRRAHVDVLPAAAEAQHNVCVSDTSPSASDVNANDFVALMVEILVFALLVAAGWQADAPLLARILLAVGLPVVAAVLWGLFAAPRARVGSAPLQLVTKVVVLGAGVVAGFLVLPLFWAVVVAAVVVVNTVLMYVGPFARRPVS